MKNRGFSAIEILVVLGILAVLVGISLSAFYGQKQQASVDRDVENVLTYLQKARNQTISSLDNSSFGVHFGTSSVSLYKGTTYTPGAVQTTYAIGASVIMNTSLNGGASSVYFQRLTGEPSVTGTVTFSIGSTSASSTKSLIIRATGLAEIQ